MLERKYGMNQERLREQLDCEANPALYEKEREGMLSRIVLNCSTFKNFDEVRVL